METDNQYANIELTYNVDTKKYVDNNKPEVDLSDYYVKSEVDDKLNDIKSAGLHREKVDVLPTVGEENIVYMVRNSSNTTQNIYDEYMFINNDWEIIGSTQVDLSNYYTKSETYSRSEIDEKVSNVKVDLTGYATEKYVEDKTGILSTDIATNKENISSISKALGELQEDIGTTDNSPKFTYDVAYNDTEDEDVGENVFVLYEITGEGTEHEVREAKRKFTIVGGSGGSGSSSLKISYVTTSPVITTVNDKVLITYNFSGTDSSGDIISDGNYIWKIGNKVIASGIATNGENTFDATDFATTTSQKFVLTITDDAGSLVTKSWTVQKVDLRLESTFSDVYAYQNNVTFNYTPYGAIEKEVHFILDGEELGSVKLSTSGIPTSYTIPAQSHGAHLLEAYMTATINNKLIDTYKL